MLASLLSCTEHAKSAFGDQNVKLKKLALSRSHLLNTTFKDARFMSLLKNTRPASLRQNAGLRKSAFSKCRWPNATISNARSAQQRHEIRVPTIERRTHKVRVSQMSLAERDNQQCEVRVSSQQRHETCVSKPKCESRLCSAERELRVSEPYVSDL